MNVRLSNGTHRNEPPTLDLFFTGVGKQTLIQMRRAMQCVDILSCKLFVFVVAAAACCFTLL